ncbi:hypothetical protein RUM43_013309 [Polyplax serrata]|uniref:Ataxin-10 n=1 Tax=Polyplax serrata TaxID=468196 RepID=A0AAN8NXN6_POLSC
MSSASELPLTVIKNFAGKPQETGNLLDLIDAFRYLRNGCAGNEEFQSMLGENPELVPNVNSILREISRKDCVDDDNAILCLTTALQFLGNFLVNNRKNQTTVWSICNDTLDKCLYVNNGKVQHCCLMILYNVFLGNPQILNSLTHSYEKVMEVAVSENFTEFAVFNIELFISSSSYMRNFYNQLSVNSRLVILEEIQRLCEDRKGLYPIPTDVLEILSKQFSKKADWILNKFKEDKDNLNVLEVVKILDVLVAFSNDDTNKRHYLEFMQKQVSLFIDLVSLLKAIHMLSREKGNIFTMETKISESNDFFNSQCSPTFGFKAALIRIIGNMSWRNRKLQSIIRDLEGIQTILDCCMIDAKNPFIMQWSILAIRNICEKNLENQQIIAEMTKKGFIDIKLLKENGILLHSEEIDGKSNAICMAALNINK